jgi:iron-sulfur cluster insertion protein
MKEMNNVIDTPVISACQKFNATNSAIEKIENIRGEDKELMLRISVYGGGCAGFKYHLEMAKEKNSDDHVMSFNGRDVLLIDETTMQMLEGGVIDFVDEMGESYFRISNPNAKGGCGCGKSFS